MDSKEEIKTQVPETSKMVLKMPKLSMPNPTVVVLGVLLLAALIFGAIFFKKYKDASGDPQKLAQRQTQDLVNQIGKIILLPTGETPTVATVSDLAPLKDQPFFANAKVGDKVLIYATAKKAFLYDPVANKIVEVAPVTDGQPQAAAPEQTTTTPAKK